MDLAKARELARSALANLERHKRRINALNVYPVPDGDTGTNLVATVEGMVRALEASRAETPQQVADEVRRAALMEAKGNSGVILSQIMRGISEVVGGHEHVDGSVLADALRQGTTRAYQGVKRPVEGTMLTVIREMAEEAELPRVRELPVDQALAAVLERGDDAVRRTPEMLEKLRESGVVDAGGLGLVELFRGIHAALAGVPLPGAPVELDELDEEAIHHEESRYRYCTVFLVEGTGLALDDLERGLEPLGDSLLVVGDASLAKVHVHTDDPDAALAVGRAMGAVDDARVEIGDMHGQADERGRWLAQLHRAAQAPPSATAVVAVAPGDGNRTLFESEGAQLVVEGGQTMNPSVGQLHEAVTAVNADHVIVLPNNGNVRLAAEEAARESTKDVRVLDTRSVPAGIAAIFAFDANAEIDDNEASMRDAAETVTAGEITVASRDTVVDGVTVRGGAWLGLVDGSVVVNDESFDVVLDAVVDELLADGRSYLTIVRGEDAPPDDELLARIVGRHPDAELEVLDGGQPHYPLLLSAE
ncbi:MAG: DAK2 domain-containing protein [Thermoleophilia bacterium]|nr:DAK2 domain-containing protein [Thermoleophilia bacterium]MDH5333615.1 DAK2 domain-containing protein [Thermoleophilia bacterium]